MRKTAATTVAKLTTPFFYVEMALGISLKAIFFWIAAVEATRHYRGLRRWKHRYYHGPDTGIWPH